MAKSALIIAIGLLLTGCNQSTNQPVEKNSRLELIPEPDRAERLKYEAIQALRKSGCVLTNPDTSICDIKIRDAASAAKMIGNKNKPDSLGQYRFYSTHERETLTLTQHPGDGANQISLFSVEYSDKASYNYHQLPIDTFKSEKGIRLGMTKQQLIQRLGNCYAGLDSTKGYIELYYRIESPKDSRTKLLGRNSMPIYYASYKLWNDKLGKFEFGFEYP
ncbi:hypothetical protein [Hymenobacter negativus]|uniref:Lipoprotein n=1 Tax=Hymenobacter negativus TaxID=2795026 RepID=A0ABS3QEC5_9BACT|nr:hypothetical protein [Hymenobacter negativus]MBO2009582.1 hypothetical protein [Hymenobacter negativus]